MPGQKEKKQTPSSTDKESDVPQATHHLEGEENNNNNNNNNLYLYSYLPQSKKVTKLKEIKSKIRLLAAWNNHKG